MYFDDLVFFWFMWIRGGLFGICVLLLIGWDLFVFVGMYIVFFVFVWDVWIEFFCNVGWIVYCIFLDFCVEFFWYGMFFDCFIVDDEIYFVLFCWIKIVLLIDVSILFLFWDFVFFFFCVLVKIVFFFLLLVWIKYDFFL